MERRRERGSHGIATLIRAAMRAPYLERDEEHELAVRWKDKRGPGGASPHHRGAYAPRHRDGRQVPQFRPADGRPRSRKAMSACWRPPPASSRSATCASRPMRPGGSAPRSRTTSCATGRSCAAARLRRRRRCSSTCAGCAPGWRRAPRAAERSTSTREIAERARRVGSRRRADGFAPVRPRHVAQRAAGRRQRLVGRTGGFPGRRTARCPTRWSRTRSTASAAPRWLQQALAVLNERELRSSRTAPARGRRHAGSARRASSASPRSACARSRAARSRSSNRP